VRYPADCPVHQLLATKFGPARVGDVLMILARPDTLDAVHAAAWGRSGQGRAIKRDYAGPLKLLIAAGDIPSDRRAPAGRLPLAGPAGEREPRCD
jgi:ribosomal protein S28E/S33